MGSEEFDKILKCVTEAVVGKGNLQKNKMCGRLTQHLWVEYNVSKNDLINGVMGYILQYNLMDRYDDSKSLGWYILGIVHNYLRNQLRSEEAVKQLKREICKEGWDNPGSYKSPEEQYLEKERHLIILNHTTQEEVKLLNGDTSIRDFAEANNISYDAAKMRKKRLTDKLYNILKSSGY